jgi:sulfur carrier protein
MIALMDVTVNGRMRRIDGTTVADLVRALGLDPERPGIAVAVAGEFVPRSDWAGRALARGDAVDVVGAVQGG